MKLIKNFRELDLKKINKFLHGPLKKNPPSSCQWNVPYELIKWCTKFQHCIIKSSRDCERIKALNLMTLTCLCLIFSRWSFRK